MNNIILFGFKSVGKTSFGQYLAKRLQRPFLDTDQMLEVKYGLSCRELCLQKGEKYFRALEKELIHSLQVENSVIALGGGAVLDADNVTFLQQKGVFFYLEGDAKRLKQRIFSGSCPSFISDENAFIEVYDRRVKIYETIEAYKILMSEESAWEAIVLDNFLELPLGGSRMAKPWES